MKLHCFFSGFSLLLLLSVMFGDLGCDLRCLGRSDMSVSLSVMFGDFGCDLRPLTEKLLMLAAVC